MKPEKKGYCFPPEVANFVWDLHKISGLNRNKVVIRLLEIARQDLAPFDDRGLRNVLRSPWGIVQNLPALKRQYERRSHGHLTSPTATRLTVAENRAFREFATKKNTTMSALQRDLVRRLLATEAA